VLAGVTGVQTGSQRVGDGTATVGSPSYDTLADELYVGSGNGRLYRFSVPF
jgi:hypothetical protein